MGSSTKEADLVVYADDECLEPQLIVECKKPDVSELEFQQAVEQAFSYAFATPKNVKFIWVTSGIKDRYFTVNKEKDERKDESDIPQFGVETLAQYKYAKGGFKQDDVQDGASTYGKQKFFELETVTEDELTRRFRQAHQSLWAGGELNPSEAFDELDKLIFCKIWDERHPRKTGEPYQFQIISEEAEGKITADEKTTAELYKRIKALYDEGQTRDPEVFKDEIRLTPQKVKTVVGYLESINLSKNDQDLLRAETGMQSGTPYVMKRSYLFTKNETGVVMQTPPPWGTLVALDVRNRKLAWEVPLGYMMDITKYPEAKNWGSLNFGGAIATAGGLIFVAATLDGHLRAFSTQDGRLQWEVPLPAGGQATPMTYQMNGKQYIVIAAGGHGKLGTKLGDYVVAYRLP